MLSSRGITIWEFRVLILLFILLIIFALPAISDASRKKVLVEGTYNLNVTSDYEEVQQLKDTTLISLEVMSPANVTATTKGWVQLVWVIIDAFNGLRALSTSSDLSDHISALYHAQTIKSEIAKLKGYSQANENGIPILAEIALSRFFNDRGKYFENAATGENSTKSKIECLEQSKIAYHEAGRISDFSRLDYEVKMSLMRYNRDMAIAGSESSSAKEYLRKAEVCKNSSDFLTVIACFKDAKRASEHNNNALKIYRLHGDEKMEHAIYIKQRIDAVNAESGQKIGAYLAALAVIFLLVAVYLLRSVGRWIETVKDTRLGDELIAMQ
jgi:hypothetical protein